MKSEESIKEMFEELFSGKIEKRIIRLIAKNKEPEEIIEELIKNSDEYD